PTLARGRAGVHARQGRGAGRSLRRCVTLAGSPQRGRGATMAGEQGRGSGLGARLALMLGLARDASGKRLVRPFVRRYGRYTSLQFSRSQTQSRMLTGEPDVLLIDYTRTMLAALLLRPGPGRIGMVGLGGGSQAKFCYRHLP